MISKINDIAVALLLIFNAGIITRFVSILSSAQTDDGIDLGKATKNFFKILVIGNSVGAIVLIIKKYFI